MVGTWIVGGSRGPQDPFTTIEPTKALALLRACDHSRPVCAYVPRSIVREIRGPRSTPWASPGVVWVVEGRDGILLPRCLPTHSRHSEWARVRCANGAGPGIREFRHRTTLRGPVGGTAAAAAEGSQPSLTGASSDVGRCDACLSIASLRRGRPSSSESSLSVGSRPSDSPQSAAPRDRSRRPGSLNKRRAVRHRDRT